MPNAGLKTIIALSFVLAIGFLLVILSCALWKVYYPLLVVATYILAPLPNWICSRCANPDDFVESSGGAIIDLGRFCTGFLVVMGIGALLLPLYAFVLMPSRPLSSCIPSSSFFFTLSLLRSKDATRKARLIISANATHFQLSLLCSRIPISSESRL